MLAVAAAITLFVGLLTPAEAADTPPDYAIANGHFYTQGSGGGASGGFSITNDGGIPMWSEYNRLGGPDVLGYPVSGRFIYQGQVVQLMQRTGLVWKPGEAQAGFLDVFSVLHQDNKDGWLYSSAGIPQQVVDPSKGWQQAAEKQFPLLDAHPAIKAAYFSVHDPVNTYGLPTSTWLEEPTVSTLRFQNVVFHQWKQLLPWAAAGTVQLANGGDLLKKSGVLGPVPFALQAAPQPLIHGTEAGLAVISYYADFFVGRHTSTGAVFSQQEYTAASNAFPLGTRLRLSSSDDARSIIVVVNDRPASWNQRIDLSKAAFQALFPLSRGTANVKVEVLR